MTYSNEDLLKLWSNSKKRREFVNGYKTWGVYLTVPELDLTFYKYDLPDGSKLIVMEYRQENYYPRDDQPKWHTGTREYLQKSEYFMPDAASGHQIEDHLKTLKQEILNGRV